MSSPHPIFAKHIPNSTLIIYAEYVHPVPNLHYSPFPPDTTLSLYRISSQSVPILEPISMTVPHFYSTSA